MSDATYAHISPHNALAETSGPGRSLLVECDDCGLVQTIPSRIEEGRIDCARCGALLSKRTTRGIEQAIVLNLTALIVFVVANVFPFITLNLQGRTQDAELISAAYALYLDGMWELGILVLLFAILLPLIKILGNLYVMIPLHMGVHPPGARLVFRWMEVVHRWAMMEVFLLGVIVGYVKLVALATVIFGAAAFSFVVLIILVVAAETVFEPRTVWERLRPSPPAAALAAADPKELISCHGCGLLNHAVEAHPHCERCDAPLHHRKPNGVARAWALISTAVVLYFPANLYPVMKMNFAGNKQGATILEGVKELLFGGMWPLALLVFFASVTVPMLKLGGLGFLLITVQRRSKWRPRERTKIYRIVDAIGRWSMLDIFVLAILVALVRFGSLATITPGTGAISFAAVVVTTMIAAESFDPRQIWDAAGANDER
ncbi:MAG: paraquat-inducible protein A [Alphaproteobacteria bacterium]